MTANVTVYRKVSLREILISPLLIMKPLNWFFEGQPAADFQKTNFYTNSQKYDETFVN